MLEAKAYLYSGELIDPQFTEDMWRVSVLGRNFCAASKQGLYEVVGFFHSIYFTTHKPIVLVPHEEKMIRVLQSNSSLTERQNALAQLEILSNKSSAASQAVVSVRSKPTSFGASYLTRALGKQDFSQVTCSEISEFVSDIVHRGQVISELSDRVKL